MAFNFYIDGFGDLSYMGDASTQYGGGLGLAGDITTDLKLIYRFSYTAITKSPLDKPPSGSMPFKKETYNSLSNRIGVEYLYPVMPRLGWRNSAMIGVNSMDYSFYPVASSIKDKKSDTGPVFEIFTGIQYNLSQHIMPFIDLGYHYTYMANEMTNMTITGFTVLMGVRVSIFGNTSIGENY